MAYDYRTCPILSGAFRYWNQKRGSGRTMPSRRDIDPIEVPQFLPHLQLTEVTDCGERFRYRLVGTAIIEAFGTEVTGKYVDELFSGERYRFIYEFYRVVCVTRQPVFSRSLYLGTKDVDLTANRLLLPLSADGVQVNMILGALTFEFASQLRAPVDHKAQIDPAASAIEVIDVAHAGSEAGQYPSSLPFADAPQ